ncbi:MAG: hypothetical protein JNL33_15200 [Betaproteobacteria bacterium]|nr:hypothetical protein [Betaproteobacteria bacterium]
MPRRLALPGLFLVSSAAIAAPGLTTFGFQAGLEHDGNINRSVDTRALSDDALLVEAHASRATSTGPASGLSLRMNLRGRVQKEFSGMSQAAIGGRVAWRYQPDRSFTGIRVDVTGSAEYLQHADSGMRDGGLLSASAAIGRNLTDRIDAALSAGADRRLGREGSVYDLATTRIGVDVDYRIRTGLSLYLHGRRVQGDHVFTWAPAAPGSGSATWTVGGRSDWYKASARDPVFDSSGRSFTAYKADARTVAFEIGLNIALSPFQALDLSVARFDSSATQGPSYDVTQFRAVYLLRLP